MREYDYVEINSRNYNIVEYEDIKFLAYAEEGAMGCPGDIQIIVQNEDGVKAFETCYEYDIQHKELCEIFPPFDKINFGFFGLVTGVDEEWKYFYLGYMNHLFVRNDVYDDFVKELIKINPKTPPDIYHNWEKISQKILLDIKYDENDLTDIYFI